jgi:hypothetical protein
MKILSTKIVCSGLLLLSLAACGNDPGDRALSGAGLGAAGGAAVGAAFGNPAAGAAIGAVGGAVTGGATSSDQIDMGKPVWR